jgi:uncharacterized membrane protein
LVALTGLTLRFTAKTAIPRSRQDPFMPETARLRGFGDPRLWRAAGAVVVAVSIAFFFWTRSAMWLDEAQTVWIAHLSLPDLFRTLKVDGSPPAFYVLLHAWMALFGTGSEAVRSLSAVFAVLSLPAMAGVARRIPLLRDRWWIPVLLLATCPFVVRYASEARMYSLVLLLVLLGVLAFERCWTAGGFGWILAAGVAAGALLLTQYWSIYLLLVVGAVAVIAAVRGNRPARRIIIALVIAAILFAPWLPTFAYQSAHTGAPWGAPPGIDVGLLAIGGWVGTGIAAPWLRLSYYALLVIAIGGYAVRSGGIRIRRPVRRLPLALFVTSLVTMLVGTIVSQISNNAYASRYSMVVLPLLLLVVAIGITALPASMQLPTLAVLCALGVISSALIPFQTRTQAAEVAAVLHKHAAPHDLVVICPDQLGPAVHRLAAGAGTQVVYPTFGSPAIVNWVNYKKRNEDSRPGQFAKAALQRSDGRPIWMIWQDGYPTLKRDCSDVYTDLTAARGRPRLFVKPSHTSFEVEQLVEFPAPAG